jgi:hypothetical protein
MYFVRASATGSPKRIEFRYRDLGPAFGQACALIKSGASDVSIRDSQGNHIEGSELAACCRGERTPLTARFAQIRPAQTLPNVPRCLDSVVSGPVVAYRRAPTSGEVEYASFPATSRVLDAFMDRSESCPAVSVDVASLSSLPLNKAGVTPRSRKTVLYIIIILPNFFIPDDNSSSGILSPLRLVSTAAPP